jgi:hypothetical protein
VSAEEAAAVANQTVQETLLEIAAEENGDTFNWTEYWTEYDLVGALSRTVFAVGL